MRESRTYGSGRGARDEIRVPTATIPPSAYPHPMDLQFRSGLGAGFQKSAARRCAAFEYAGEPRVNDVDIASFRKVVSINAAENCPSYRACEHEV